VEFTVCPLCVPPLPPVYGISLLIPLAKVKAFNDPLLIAEPQFSVIEPTG
jgi:hypothetical protein